MGRSQVKFNQRNPHRIQHKNQQRRPRKETSHPHPHPNPHTNTTEKQKSSQEAINTKDAALQAFLQAGDLHHSYQVGAHYSLHDDNNNEEEEVGLIGDGDWDKDADAPNLAICVLEDRVVQGLQNMKVGMGQLWMLFGEKGGDEDEDGVFGDGEDWVEENGLLRLHQDVARYLDYEEYDESLDENGGIGDEDNSVEKEKNDEQIVDKNTQVSSELSTAPLPSINVDVVADDDSDDNDEEDLEDWLDDMIS